MPIISVNHSCCVLISTFGKNTNNIFTRIMHSNVFNNHEIKYICDTCQSLALTTGACIHLQHRRPEWLGLKDGIARKIFGDDDEVLLRETMGILVEDTNSCFPSHLIDALQRKPFVNTYGSVNYVVMSIDPAAGTDVEEKSTSDFAIVSIGKPDTTILGMEAINYLRHQDYETVLKDHIERIRKIPGYEGSYLVVDIEANGNGEWSHLVSFLSQFPNVIIMSDYKRKEGTNTTNQSKLEMMKLTRAILDEDSVGFAKSFVTSNKSANEVVKLFLKQMRQYERLVIPSKSLKISNAVILSGKGPNKTQKDDLCLTFQRAVRSRKVFLESSKYAKYRA